jgi:signal recognition particle subunit SRP54
MNDKEGQKKIKKYLVILDSFNQKELDMDKPLEESRMKRIARGAGVPLYDVACLIEEFKNLKKMITGFAGVNMGKGKTIFIFLFTFKETKCRI